VPQGLLLLTYPEEALTLVVVTLVVVILAAVTSLNLTEGVTESATVLKESHQKMLHQKPYYLFPTCQTNAFGFSCFCSLYNR
jgi:glycerol-3-phosphate acyltransferase PlsY